MNHDRRLTYYRKRFNMLMFLNNAVNLNEKHQEEGV